MFNLLNLEIFCMQQNFKKRKWNWTETVSSTYFAVLTPNVTVSPQSLILKTATRKSAYCNISGQVEMHTSIQKPVEGLFMTERLLSNETSGLRNDISRRLDFEHRQIKKFDTSCSLEKKQSVVVCRKIYTCTASYSFASSISVIAENNISVAVHQGEII